MQCGDDVLRMLSEGFSTKRGRRSALLHHDAINHRVRGRRGARLLALMNATEAREFQENSVGQVITQPFATQR